MAVLDLLIVGAGPSGLATAIAARQQGLDYEILEKGVLVNSIFHFPAHMVFFTTPELLEIGGLPLVTPYDKPTRIEALRYYRRVTEKFDLPMTFGETVTGASTARRTGVFVVRRTRGGRARAAGARRRARHWLLRSSQPAGRARRGPAARLALLPGRALHYRQARRHRRRQELGGGGRAGAVSRWRARHDGPSARDAWRLDQVLGEARHREPHRGRIDRGALRDDGRGNHAGGGRDRATADSANPCRPTRSSC